MCEAELWDEALSQYNRMRSAGEFPEGLLVEYLARIYLGRGQYESVRRMVGREGAQSILVPATLACLHLRQKDRAVRLAEQAAREKRPGAGLAMGAVREATQDLEEALGWYEWEASRFTSIRQDQPLRAAARVLMELGEFGEARVAIENAIRQSQFLHPEDVECLEKCLQPGKDRHALIREEKRG